MTIEDLALDTDITIFERFLLSVLKEELSELYRDRLGSNKQYKKKTEMMRPDFDYDDWEEIYTRYKSTEIEEAKELLHELMLNQAKKIDEKGRK